MVGPEEVDADGVEAISLELLEDITPQLRHGQACVVEFAGEDEDALAVDHEAVGIPCNSICQVVARGVREKCHCQKQ